jgi:DNA-binding GntR family transcriptional regulator
MVIAGELTPGTRLRQAEIARHFGVSTTPVREAFTALAGEGLLSQDSHRGVVVFLPTVESLRENYEIREPLEAIAAANAAKHANDREIKKIEQLAQRMLNEDSVTRRKDLNSQFHRAIYSASNRPRLQEIIESLRAAAEVFVLIYLSRSPDPAVSLSAAQEHTEIAAAISQRDSQRAAKLMSRHLRHSAERFERALREFTAT